MATVPSGSGRLIYYVESLPSGGTVAFDSAGYAYDSTSGGTQLGISTVPHFTPSFGRHVHAFEWKQVEIHESVGSPPRATHVIVSVPRSPSASSALVDRFNHT